MNELVSETSTPLLVAIDDLNSVTELVVERAKLAPNDHAFLLRRDPESTSLTPVTTREFVQSVTEVAKGLLNAGVASGDRIAIQGATGFAWAVADLACLWVGAITVPLFDTAAPGQVRAIVADAEVKFAFASTPEQRRTLEESIPAAHIFTLEFAGENGLDHLATTGTAITDDELEARRAMSRLDDTATLVYTSGTEGRPKGVRITHRNLVGQVLNISADYDQVVRSGGRTLIFLPLAHVLARALQLMCITQGMTISYEAEPSRAVSMLPHVQPTFLVVVPRVLQKIRERIAQAADDKHLGWLWRRAEQTAIEHGRLLQEAQPKAPQIPVGLRLRLALFDRLFFAKIRGLLGGKIEYILSGAAPLSAEVGLFYRGVGVEVIEGYGLTETTAPVTGNKPGDNYCGTVGRPSPGHTVRITADGEVLASGVGVSPGYWNEADNARAYVDGFLRTGDLGTLDGDGRLTITGRAKEVIVTAGGKTISPQLWQQSLEADPLVSYAVVVGDSRPYPAALIFVDPEALGTAAPNEPETITDRNLIARIATLVEQANGTVSGPERVKRFSVISADLTPGGDFVTSTMKLRRAHVLDAMSAQIDDIYQRQESTP